MHSQLHSPAVNHPGAQRPVLPRKENAELSSRCPEAGSALEKKCRIVMSQTDKRINIVRCDDRGQKEGLDSPSVE
jgi:hypothetical protein